MHIQRSWNTHARVITEPDFLPFPFSLCAAPQQLMHFSLLQFHMPFANPALRLVAQPAGSATRNLSPISFPAHTRIPSPLPYPTQGAKHSLVRKREKRPVLPCQQAPAQGRKRTAQKWGSSSSPQLL